MKVIMIIIVLIITVGCSTRTNLRSDSPAESIQPAIVFLQASDFEGETTSMGAELIGEMVVVNDCIRIDRFDNESSYLPIWPSTFKLRLINHKIQIVNGEDEVIAQERDHLRLSGGEIPALSQSLRASLPENCPGPYWSVGNEITIIP